jgi:hypothetical protein
MMCSRSASPQPIRTTSSRSIAARFSIPPERRARCRVGARRAADHRSESRSTSRSPPPITVSMSTCAAPGRCRQAMIATLSRVAEQHRLARLTRHGELVLMRAPPTIAVGAAQVTLPPGSFLQATAAGEEALAALVPDIASAPSTSPICFAGSGRSRLRLARNRGFRIRQRCRRGSGAAEGGELDTGFEADQGRGARSVPASADAAGAARLRYGRCSIRRGRARRRKCAARGQQDSSGGCGVMQCREPLRATHGS